MAYNPIISVRIPAELLALLKARASAEQRPLSNMIVVLLYESLAAHISSPFPISSQRKEMVSHD